MDHATKFYGDLGDPHDTRHPGAGNPRGLLPPPDALNENNCRTGAALKFLSIEPLLEDLDTFDLTGIDWVIVCGESGPGARPLKEEWVTSIQESQEELKEALARG